MAIFIGIGTGTWIVFVNYFWEYFGKDDCSLVKYRTQSRPKILTSKSAKKAGFRSFLKIMVVIKDNFSIKLTPSIPILQYLQNENANEFFWSIALLRIVFLRKSLWRRQLLSANLHSL